MCKKSRAFFAQTWRAARGLHKIQISGFFDVGGFGPKIIDFVKEFNKETAHSPKLKLLRPQNSVLARGSFLTKFLYKINEFGLEISKIENSRNLEFSRPRAAHQVCVKKAQRFLHKLGPQICVSTHPLPPAWISLRKLGSVYLHKSVGQVCAKKAGLFLHKPGGRPAASTKSRFRDFSMLAVSGPKSSIL